MKKRKNFFIGALLVILMFMLIWACLWVFYYSKNYAFSHLNRLSIIINNKNKPYNASINVIKNQKIKNVIKRLREKSLLPAQLKIYGVLLIEHTEKFNFSLSASQSAAFFIDNKLVVKNSKFYNQKEIELCKGLHDIRMEIFADEGENNIFLFLRQSDIGDWEYLKEEILLNPKAHGYSFQKLKEIKEKIKNANKIRSYGYIFIGLFIILFISLVFIKIKKNYSDYFKKFIDNGIEVKNQIKQKVIPGSKRFVEIDITKGFAALLMIITHIEGSRLFPFGNCGAGLFFFCSGINTILFFKKTISKKNSTGYFLFFVLLLFFGGYTQIKIAHPEIDTFIPEFLQFSALSILLVFVLMKILKNTRMVGYLFPLPFLLHLGFQNNYLSFLKLEGIWSGFIFGTGGFPLFPWSGYFLFGIFLFYFRKKRLGLQFVLLLTGSLSMFTIFILKIPVNKFNMSLSYIVLSLFVATFWFFCFSMIYSKVKNGIIKVIQKGFALVGRNSLMFVYLHYFILLYLKSKIPELDLIFEILIQSILSYIFLIFGIYCYEKIKRDYSLLLPTFFITGTLAFLRYTNLLAENINMRIIDMLIGILFAFLYVQLRGKMRFFLREKKC